MNYPTPIDLLPKTDPVVPTLRKTPGPNQLAKQFDKAKTGNELLQTVAQNGIAPLIPDGAAGSLALSPESLNNELTAPKIKAVQNLEAKLPGNFVESQYPDIPDVKELAKYLSPAEINTAQFAALARQANELVKLVNEKGPEEAAGAAQWLKSVETHLAQGGALTTPFVLSALDMSIGVIAAGGAMTAAMQSAQMQFSGFFDPTDPNSQRQVSDVMTTDSTMQDSE